MPLPCVEGNQDGLVVFQSTADQRYALGKETFLSTHLPVRFWRHWAGRRETWTEEDLLQCLLVSPSNLKGNRVYVLFGAAGSGKSEVMRWLMCRIAEAAPERVRFMARIPRTELDPVRIVHRLLSTFQLPGVDQGTLQRWSVLRQKPVAVANQVVWQALIGTCDNDAEILPLSYRLRPIVEANLRTSFASVDDPEMAGRPVQLLSLEQMEQALSDAVLPVQLSYEQLRARLQEAFDELVLGGVRLVPAMRAISRSLRDQFGVRPILIIDDLVQSMNVYASDLLDYFITLEEGEWDVVVGLTPASFDLDRRGRELLVRIRELDTVDDRVIKLDLSDTAGDHSAFLQEGSAADLLLPYLDQYKRAKGYTCGEACDHWPRCAAMQWDAGGDTRLGPLNRAFISRLWHGLPTGKGRVRYLLLAVRDVLAVMAARGPQALIELPRFIQRDRFVEHDSPAVRALLECYAPSQSDTVTIPPGLEAIWNLRLPKAATAQRLLPDTAEGHLPVARVPDEPRTDPVFVAVRDWLEGASPNPELLRPLRAGTARLLRDLVDPGLIAGVGRAQCTGVLRWSVVQHGSFLPISIEGVEEPSSLHLSRMLGGAAFDLVAYGTSRGHARTARLQRLLVEPQIVELIYRAEEQRRTWQWELEAALGCSVRELAFHLYRIMVSLGGSEASTPLSLQSEAAPSVAEVAWPDGLKRLVSSLFQDCFLIREHLWDGQGLSELIDHYPQPEASLARAETLMRRSLPAAVSSNYRLGELSIADFLHQYQSHLARIVGYVERQRSQMPERRRVAETYSALADGRRRRAVQRRGLRLSSEARGNILVPKLPSILSETPAEWPEAFARLRSLLDLEASHIDTMSPFTLYRISADWSQAERHKSVIELVQWRQGLKHLLNQMEAQSSHETTDPAPLTTPLLLERIQALLARLHTSADGAGPVVPGAGDALVSVLSRLIVLLVPRGFRVVEWAGVSLDGGHPTSRGLPRLLLAVSRASAWWQAYIQQLPLVTRCESPEALSAALAFVRSAGSLEEPSAEYIRTWVRFVSRMRKAGLMDLPARCRCHSGKYDGVPARLRDWLCHQAEGSRLADLDPGILRELLQHAPHLAQWLRITMVPEVSEHGVLCLMDRQ